MSAAPLVTIASEFLARASSTSEVLTLNLTNLLILLVLKALIFGFGLFSVGSSARSSDDGPVVNQSDIAGGMCFMMYAAGAEDKLSCVQRTACEDPKTAGNYETAAKMIYKAQKMLGMEFGEKYETVLFSMTDARLHGLQGGDCSVYRW